MLYKILSLFPECEIENRKCFIAKQRWAEQKNRNFGLELCKGAVFCGKYGIPKVETYIGEIPNRFITLSELNRYGAPNVGVACADFDYVLEELWRNPQKFTSVLTTYKCFAMPDFSLCVGDPLSVQIANTYRNHAIAYYMQKTMLELFLRPVDQLPPLMSFVLMAFQKVVLYSYQQ